MPLSDQGQRQADAVGRWLAGLPQAHRPTVALSSPYRRARETARAALSGLDGVSLHVDERLRDRELGVLDLHTVAGILARHPEEAARRKRLGKLYHRPPGGESWADVALRLRAVLGDVKLDFAGERVVLFTHEAPVLLARYILEGLSEEELMRVARSTALANCSVTKYERGADQKLHLAAFNTTDMLDKEGARSTAEADVDAEPV